MNTPWQIRKLEDGWWAVDQVWDGHKRRFGVYSTEAEAREILNTLMGSK